MRLSEIPETVEEIFEWIQKEDPTIVEKETEKFLFKSTESIFEKR